MNENRETIYIGVAWPYANDMLHLGHFAGSLLPPDIFARYHRMKGNKVLMTSGSDCHGTPITVTAEKEKVSPREVAERYHRLNSEAIEKFGISFDLFTTTMTDNHKKVVQDIFLKLYEKGYIYKKKMTAPYCTKCAKFLPDRYIEGICPYCKSQGARGDQCDNCGKTLDPEELIEPVCKLCGSKPEMRETEHFFLKLSAFSERLKSWIATKDFWRPNVKTFTYNWLEVLKDRPITRDISWGIEIPIKGYENKRIYVWFEAVIGYLSSSKEWAQRLGNPDAWKEFWLNEECKPYYFLGKDNIPFHTIIWPAILMGYGDLNLPYDVPANEYLLLRGEKFSKSRRHAIYMLNYLKKLPPDPLRYYLSINMPDTRDLDFTWEEFIKKNNDELVNTYGNFINRALTFTFKNFEKVPEGPNENEYEEIDKEAIEKIKNAYEETTKYISSTDFKRGIKSIMDLAIFGNVYIDRTRPWELLRKDKKRCGHVLHISLRITKALAVLSHPYLPFSTQKIWEFLGYKDNLSNRKWEDALEDIDAGQTLTKPSPLFKKLELSDIIEAEEKKENALEQLSKFDIVKGKVKSVAPHPKADKLYLVKVSIGEEERQLVAGLKNYYAPSELENKDCFVVANLEPAKLRGLESQGMLLALDDGKEHVSLLTPLTSVADGSRLAVFGRKASRPKPLNSLTEFQKLDIRIGTAKDKKENILFVDIGNEKEIKIAAENLQNVDNVIGKRIAVLIDTENSGFLLSTEDGTLITFDSQKPVPDGARAR